MAKRYTPQAPCLCYRPNCPYPQLDVFLRQVVALPLAPVTFSAIVRTKNAQPPAAGHLGAAGAGGPVDSATSGRTAATEAAGGAGECDGVWIRRVAGCGEGGHGTVV